VFPEFLGEVTLAVAQYARLRPDAPAVMLLGAIGAAAASRYTLRFGAERHPTALWVLALLPSGSGKTPLLEQVARPFVARQAELREEAAVRARGRQVDHRVLVRRRGALVTRLAGLLPTNPDGAAEREDLRRQLIDLEEQLDKFSDVRQPTLLCDDTTVPALVEELAAQDGTITLMSDEGSTFFRSVSGAAASEPIEPVLQAWSGQAIRVHRISRSSLTIEKPALSALLATQPSVVREHVRRGAFSGRGLWERFMYVEPEPLGSRSQLANLRSSANELAMYSALLSDLVRRETGGRREIGLATDAQERLREFSAQVDERVREGDLSDAHLVGWAQKIRSNTIRLAGVLHVACQTSDPPPICRTAVEGAIQIMEWEIGHARHVLAAAVDPNDTEVILDHLRRRPEHLVSIRDLRRTLPRGLRDGRDGSFDRALDEPRMRGLIRLHDGHGGLGRPSPGVELHPALRAASLGAQQGGAKTPEVSNAAPAAEVSASRHRPPTDRERTNAPDAPLGTRLALTRPGPLPEVSSVPTAPAEPETPSASGAPTNAGSHERGERRSRARKPVPESANDEDHNLERALFDLAMNSDE
jgi:hypothetical protein